MIFNNKIKSFSILLIGLLIFSGCSINEDKPSISQMNTEANQEADDIYIYLVRHGKTFFNTTGQVQGWSDTPLTDKGIQGAKEVAEGLKDISFVTAYSSDLGRARSTAHYILEKGDRGGLMAKELTGIREWFYGGYEGKTNAEMWIPIFESQGLTFDEDWSQYGTLVQKLSDEEISNTIAANDPTKTAENYSQITERTKQAIQQIVDETKKAGGGNALAVSHGGEIATILEAFVPGQYKGEDIGNCTVTILKVSDGKYSLVSAGDKSFLEKGAAALRK
ncbi:histidine phosphatase family protein [Paenibacillus sp. NPDC057967]|uniref:histidine phosphatase family protein n=1 Tax=Paenibacillus sp. NPDC057967 TaxID=3346293 RepID=UPI0036DDE364